MTKSRVALVTVAGLVLAVATAGTLVADEVFVESAENGLIAYSYAGDIYVGDPVTGETTAIVTNPTYEVNPVFSPDGTRIAFMRVIPTMTRAFWSSALTARTSAS